MVERRTAFTYDEVITIDLHAGTAHPPARPPNHVVLTWPLAPLESTLWKRARREKCELMKLEDSRIDNNTRIHSNPWEMHDRVTEEVTVKLVDRAG